MAEKTNYSYSTDSGFTLIELSIVLVIIGLIVGAILVGQDLIKAAEIRSTISQVGKTTQPSKLSSSSMPRFPATFSRHKQLPLVFSVKPRWRERLAIRTVTA